MESHIAELQVATLGLGFSTIAYFLAVPGPESSVAFAPFLVTVAIMAKWVFERFDDREPEESGELEEVGAE